MTHDRQNCQKTTYYYAINRGSRSSTFIPVDHPLWIWLWKTAKVAELSSIKEDKDLFCRKTIRKWSNARAYFKVYSFIIISSEVSFTPWYNFERLPKSKKKKSLCSSLIRFTDSKILFLTRLTWQSGSASYTTVFGSSCSLANHF